MVGTASHRSGETPAPSPSSGPPAPSALVGPYGAPALAHAARFAELGATAAWFHGFDADAFAVCERHGIAAAVEFPTFRADLDAHPELAPIGVDGDPIRHGDLVQGVCLSQPDFLDAIEERLRAGLAEHAPVGVWLDYLTGAGWFETADPDLQESCFCSGCVATFAEDTGLDVTDPRRILAEHAEDWTAHLCRRIAGYAEHYATIIETLRPGCLVGAYTCPWLPDEHDDAVRRIFGQDHELLAEHLDVVTPLIYATKSGRGPGWGAEHLVAARRRGPEGVAVQLIVDALDGPEALRRTAASPVPSAGLQVFSGAQLFTDPDLGRAFSELAARLTD